MSRTGAIGAIVVTYNSEEVVERCVAAAIAQGLEVIVVDNASADDSVARAHGTSKVIRNATNLGFAEAANQGFAAVGEAECVLLLNPDVEITSSIAPMVEACRRHGSARYSKSMKHFLERQ